MTACDYPALTYAREEQTNKFSAVEYYLPCYLEEAWKLDNLVLVNYNDLNIQSHFQDVYKS